jgi:mRNA interferase RelE/StbE
MGGRIRILRVFVKIYVSIFSFTCPKQRIRVLPADPYGSIASSSVRSCLVENLGGKTPRFERVGQRDFKRLDRPIQRRIITALDRLTDDPPAGDVVKLANTDGWRLRVGDWRFRFERDGETGVVNVLRVLPRGRAYRD